MLNHPVFEWQCGYQALFGVIYPEIPVLSRPERLINKLVLYLDEVALQIKREFQHFLLEPFAPSGLHVSQLKVLEIVNSGVEIGICFGYFTHPLMRVATHDGRKPTGHGLPVYVFCRPGFRRDRDLDSFA